MEHFQSTFLPAFAWLVFGVIALAIGVWVLRILLFIKNEDEPWANDETLGLPKGSVRTFIVISFTAIMFLTFFGNFTGIPPEDRKWFLTAYSSVLAFYFGTKYFQPRSESHGLAISSISLTSGTRPASGTQWADLAIQGSGFESPTGVRFTNGAHALNTANLAVDSHEKLRVALELANTTPTGAYDVAVELANGSKIVYKSGFTVK